MPGDIKGEMDGYSFTISASGSFPVCRGMPSTYFSHYRLEALVSILYEFISVLKGRVGG